MVVKLGELLIKRGAITEHQLKEALTAQKVFGGRLGTNLVELGYITETDLAKLLSQQMKIPYVDASDFDNIDKETIDAIPTAIAEKYRVVPLEIANRRIKVAMADPTNFGALDEISFATGLTIVPVVAPEILITYALEKYYDVARSMRYIRMPNFAEHIAQAVTTAKPPPPPPKELSFSALKEETFDIPEEKEGSRIENAVNRMVAAKALPDVFEVIRDFVSEDFEMLAVFVFRGDTAKGFMHVGCKLTQEEFQKMQFPCFNSELFKKVCKTKLPYTGMPIPSAVDGWILSSLGFAMEQRIFCMPIIVNNMAAAVLMASGSKKGELLEIAASYYPFAKKVGYTFEMLYLRNRILDLSEG